jgi:hypothetical protein
VAVFAPHVRHSDLRSALQAIERQRLQEGATLQPEELPACLDPTWGLERMIAALANVPEEYAGPLPWY